MNSKTSTKTGRNEPCPCGSGKKYKACCLQTTENTKQVQGADFEELHRRGQQAVAQGNFKDAELWFRQMLAVKPKDAYALACVGQSLCWRLKRREGVAFLLLAAKQLEKQAMKSGKPEFLLELSEQLLHWGESQAAENLARLAVKLVPHSPAALNNLVVCLTRINRDAEALPLSRQVCELLPDNPACNILLAIIEANLGDRSAAMARLERVIALNANKEQTARAQLELAKLLDKRGEYDAAFAAISQANIVREGMVKSLVVSQEFLFSSIVRNKTGFTQALLQRWPVETLTADGLPIPAFLVGFLRSGTTLTEQVLAAHPSIIATDESTIVEELIQQLAVISKIQNNIPAALASLDLSQIQSLRRYFWQRLREEHGDVIMHKQLVDKNALNSIELGFISVVFPEARILFALRDPRDICLSCYMQAFTFSPATVNLLRWEGVARQYAAVMDYWLYLKNQIQPGFLELRYEDCVLNFEASYRQVFDFLGVDWVPEVADFHQHAQGSFISTPSFSDVSRPLYSSAISRWKNYAKFFQSVLPQLERFIQVFGYERN